MEHPRTRRLEAFPLTHQGREMIGLRDPEGYFPDVAAVSPAAYFIASLCDGRRSLREIQAAYVRRYGDIITTGQLEAILQQLDDQLILDSPRFRRLKEESDREYMGLPNRPMTLAGLSYSPQPRELAGEIAAMLEAAEGSDSDAGPPLGLVAPHIDPGRGARCYGETYSYLARCTGGAPPPLVVILGTCHGEMEGAFALTSKNYLSPFGLVRTDAGAAAEVARAAGMDGLGDELSHRREHSIEMQLPFLALVFGGVENFSILPVTCNSFHPFIEAQASPRRTRRSPPSSGRSRPEVGAGRRGDVPRPPPTWLTWEAASGACCRRTRPSSPPSPPRTGRCWGTRRPPTRRASTAS